jgi:hypothetical protein
MTQKVKVMSPDFVPGTSFVTLKATSHQFHIFYLEIFYSYINPEAHSFKGMVA